MKLKTFKMKKALLFFSLISSAAFAQDWKLAKDNKSFPADAYYKLYENKDTLYAGETYKAYIEIDTTKIKDINKIAAFYDKAVVIARYGNKFEIEIRTSAEGVQSLDITLYNSEQKPYTTAKFTHKIFVRKPSRTSIASVDYIVVPEKYPTCNSKNYKDFNDYLIQSFKKENIKAHGKVAIDYTVMKDGSTRFEQIKGYGFDDRDKISKIVAAFHDWVAGEDKGQKVNVYISAICDFK